MTWTLFLVLLAAAAAVSPVAILAIPRARRSTGFDLLLWGATVLVAFLGAWYAYGSSNPDSPPGGWSIAGVPLIPIALGALIGALAVNAPLWVLDRVERPFEGDEDGEWPEEEEEESKSITIPLNGHAAQEQAKEPGLTSAGDEERIE